MAYREILFKHVLFALFLFIGSIFIVGTVYAAKYTYMTQWSVPYSSLAIAANAYGTEYVLADNTIYKYSPDGNLQSQFGAGDTGLIGATDIAVDSSGYIYVADTADFALKKFDDSGGYVSRTTIDESVPGYHYGISAIAVGGDGRIYATTPDYGYILNSNLVNVGSFRDNHMVNPGFDHFAADNGGNVYIADSNGAVCRITKYSSGGSQLFGFGQCGGYDTTNGYFSYIIAGMATDYNNNLFVVDQNGESVQKFNSNGAFLLKVAGAGSGDGQLNEPTDVAVDTLNYVYILDPQAQRVQKFRLDQCSTASQCPDTYSNCGHPTCTDGQCGNVIDTDSLCSGTCGTCSSSGVCNQNNVGLCTNTVSNPYCSDATHLRTYSRTCSGGFCGQSSSDASCPATYGTGYTCVSGQCVAPPEGCQNNIECPGDCKICQVSTGLCVNAATGSNPKGTCPTGSCYTGTCNSAGSCGVIANGQKGSCSTCQQCNGAGSCVNVADGTDPFSQCRSPWDSSCADNIYTYYDKNGVCNSGSCVYTANNVDCDDGKSCTTDICDTSKGCHHTVSCTNPPDNFCSSASMNAYTNPGSCNTFGNCQYTPVTVTACTANAKQCINTDVLRSSTPACNSGNTACQAVSSDLSCTTAYGVGYYCDSSSTSCLPYTCLVNSVRDSSRGESGVDCGGPSCPACSCTVSGDCADAYGVCGDPTCVSNACGNIIHRGLGCQGACRTCASDGSCTVDNAALCTTPAKACVGNSIRTYQATCINGNCGTQYSDTACNAGYYCDTSTITCQPYPCQINGVQDSARGESGVDCGGPSCPACSCTVSGDCADTFGVCGNPTCVGNKCGNTFNTGFLCAGTCRVCANDGSCSVDSNSLCASGQTCFGGLCLGGDDCNANGCNNPPADQCDGIFAIKRFDNPGVCAPSTGQCDYSRYASIHCPGGQTCFAGICQGPTDCTVNGCSNPPSDECDGLRAIKRYHNPGICDSGTGLCDYSGYNSISCPNTQMCSGGVCVAGDCTVNGCNNPPGDSCDGSYAIKQYNNPGYCNPGTGACDYSGYTTNNCPAGEWCQNDACVNSCGNRITESPEQCDDGSSNNGWNNRCLPNCQLATCGDGYVWTGHEECDGGANCQSCYFSDCTINNVDITCSGGIDGVGGVCAKADTLGLSVTYTNGGHCNLADNLQVDFSDPARTCVIQYIGGQMFGINHAFNIATNPFAFNYLLPNITDPCAGKSLSVVAAALRTGVPPSTIVRSNYYSGNVSPIVLNQCKQYGTTTPYSLFSEPSWFDVIIGANSCISYTCSNYAAKPVTTSASGNIGVNIYDLNTSAYKFYQCGVVDNVCPDNFTYNGGCGATGVCTLTGHPDTDCLPHTYMYSANTLVGSDLVSTVTVPIPRPHKYCAHADDCLLSDTNGQNRVCYTNGANVTKSDGNVIHCAGRAITGAIVNMWCPRYYDYSSTLGRCIYIGEDCSANCTYAATIGSNGFDVYNTNAQLYGELVQNYMNNRDCFKMNPNTKKIQYCAQISAWPQPIYTYNGVGIMSAGSIHLWSDNRYGVYEARIDGTG